MTKKQTNDLKKTETERQLLSRFKKMGIILLAFSVLFLGYAFVVHPSPWDDGVKTPAESELSSGLSNFSVQELSEEGLLPEETLNFFAISLVFAGIGIACILTAWKRSQNLPPHSEDL